MKRGDKTIDDVSRAEWAELASATQELLNCAMFLTWLNGNEKDDDRSVVDTIERAAKALRAVGLKQSTLAEFISNLEDMLKSGMPPEHWHALRNAGGRKQ